MITKHGKGIYRILHDKGGWCVAKLNEYSGIWHRVSNLYAYRGWAQNYARRMRIPVVNYESYYG